MCKAAGKRHAQCGRGTIRQKEKAKTTKKRKAGSSKIKVESQQDEKCKPFMVALASIKERHSVNSMGLNGLY